MTAVALSNGSSGVRAISKNPHYNIVFVAAVLVALCQPSTSYGQTAADFSSPGGGSVILGADADACDVSKEGALRYSSSSKCAEYCNGSFWICPANGSCDETPYTVSSAGVYGFEVPTACASLLVEAYGAGGGDNVGGGGGGSIVFDSNTVLVAGGGGGGGGSNDAGGGGGYSADTIAVTSVSDTALVLLVGEGGECDNGNGGEVGGIDYDFNPGTYARSGSFSEFGGTGGVWANSSGNATAGTSTYGGGGGAHGTSSGAPNAGDSTFGGGGGRTWSGSTAGTNGTSVNGNNGTDNGGGGGGGFPVANAINGADGNGATGGTAANSGPGNGADTACTTKASDGRIVITPFWGGSGGCLLLSGFDFNDVSVGLGATAASNLQQVVTDSCSVNISISGDGSPQLRTCTNGSSEASCDASVVQNWATSGTVSNGQYLQLRLTASSVDTEVRTATVNVGELSDNWSVTATTCNTTPTVYSTAGSFNYSLPPACSNLQIEAYGGGGGYNRGGGGGGSAILDNATLLVAGGGGGGGGNNDAGGGGGYGIDTVAISSLSGANLSVYVGEGGECVNGNGGEVGGTAYVNHGGLGDFTAPDTTYGGTGGGRKTSTGNFFIGDSIYGGGGGGHHTSTGNMNGGDSTYGGGGGATHGGTGSPNGGNSTNANNGTTIGGGGGGGFPLGTAQIGSDGNNATAGAAANSGPGSGGGSSCSTKAGDGQVVITPS